MQMGKEYFVPIILKLTFLFIFIPAISFAQTCLIENGTLEEFLNSPKTLFQAACPKLSKNTDIVGAINLIDKYWEKSTSNADRYSMLTEHNKGIHKSVFGVSEPKNYRIPGIDYERILGDYHYNYVRIDSSDFIQISLQIEWEQEGYRGNMTYIFDLLREKSKWHISNIMN
jgi:hypothetical protein